jgi:photosystem II stability/assembly factor-like uncharacterized protein
MAKTKTRLRPVRTVQAPERRQAERRLPGWAYALAAALVLAALSAGAFLLATQSGQESGGPAASAAGLPQTSDYHSLLVAPANARHLFLGTHEGLYESLDGGRSWAQAALAGQDAMNLSHGGVEIEWAAGHDVFAKSADGGSTWTDVQPEGLPSLDIHGFAVDPRNSERLYAAVAGQGLYRSDDGGASFELVSTSVGGAVMALAITPEGRILAGDMEQGLVASDDHGKTWRSLAQAAVVGLAINPVDPKTILAGGPGILLSTDGGRSWRQVLTIEQGAGPIAWSRSDADLGYAVGFDRVLYRTNDRGRTWQPVP